jgi:hypothetical protein
MLQAVSGVQEGPEDSTMVTPALSRVATRESDVSGAQPEIIHAAAPRNATLVWTLDIRDMEAPPPLTVECPRGICLLKS